MGRLAQICVDFGYCYICNEPETVLYTTAMREFYYFSIERIAQSDRNFVEWCDGE